MASVNKKQQDDTINGTNANNQSECQPTKLLRQKKIGPFMMDTVDVIVFVIVIAACASILAFRLVWHPVVVSGVSMHPTFKSGDVLKTSHKFTRNDLTYGTVIVFKSHVKGRPEYIKRIEGVPGDTISIHDGYLYRNDEKVVEYLEEEKEYPKMEDPGEFSDIVLQEDEYFVLGDNRNNSSDSRWLGTIQYEDIEGIVNDTNPVFTF